MKEPKLIFRDILALPFMFIMLGVGFIANVIGGKWTAYQLINLFK